jgi:hypothetical protein
LPSESIQALFTNHPILDFNCCHARHDDHYPLGNNLDQNSTKQFLGSNVTLESINPRSLSSPWIWVEPILGKEKPAKQSKAKQSKLWVLRKFCGDLF